MNIAKGIGIALLVLIAIFAIGFGGQALNLWQFQFWAPKYENARRQVFEQTRSYNSGMLQELQAYQIEYVKAKAHKDQAVMDVIASTVRHRYADFNPPELNADLRRFLEEVRHPEAHSY